VSAPGLSWTPRYLLLGATFALPAAIVAGFDPRLGVALALGVLPAASMGLPARRIARLRYPVVGFAVGAAILLGSLLAQWPVVALIVLFAACVGAAVLSTAGPAGGLVLALGVPMIGIGFSFDDTGNAIVIALLILAGSVWCLLVALPWPEREAAQRPPAPPVGSMVGFGIRLGLAGTIAASIGFALGLEHVGWAAGAALLVMRPTGRLVVSRALARAASVVAGALLGGAFMLTQPEDWLIGLVALILLTVLTALAGSRWYVTGGFSTFLVFMALLGGDAGDTAHRFWERTLETVLGVALALVFGLLVPWIGDRIRRGR
jgi:hypothetical protein